MSDEPKTDQRKENRSRRVVVTILLFFAMTAYVLSIGPVNTLSAMGWIPQSWNGPLNVVYAPFGFAQRQSERVNWIVHWWIGVCNRTAGR